MEFMDAGSLETIMNSRIDSAHIPENIIAAIAVQLLRGLDYLHHVKRVVHRDIKPANVLVNKQGHVKLADFGMAGIGSSSNETNVFHTNVGTQNYMSPERLQGNEHSFDSDLWSLGVTLVECAIGKFPFVMSVNPNMMMPSAQQGHHNHHQQQQQQQPMGGIFELLSSIESKRHEKLMVRHKCSTVMMNFMNRLLTIETKQRPTIAQLMTDPFIAELATKSHEELSNIVKQYVH